jgi:hypothetical protein
MVEDLTSSNNVEANTKEQNALSKIEEPNDLFMVLQRDSRLDSVETFKEQKSIQETPPVITDSCCN